MSFIRTYWNTYFSKSKKVDEFYEQLNHEELEHLNNCAIAFARALSQPYKPWEYRKIVKRTKETDHPNPFLIKNFKKL
jgi:hypothetical protein